MTFRETSYAGTLQSVTVRLNESDPKSRVDQPFVLELDRPVCLPAGFDKKETASIQVYASNDTLHAQLGTLKGKHITVTGEGFQSHTSHHHRPIVVDVTRISAK